MNTTTANALFVAITTAIYRNERQDNQRGESLEWLT
jgi:hypothetical protein